MAVAVLIDGEATATAEAVPVVGRAARRGVRRAAIAVAAVAVAAAAAALLLWMRDPAPETLNQATQPDAQQPGAERPEPGKPPARKPTQPVPPMRETPTRTLAPSSVDEEIADAHKPTRRGDKTRAAPEPAPEPERLATSALIKKAAATSTVGQYEKALRLCSDALERAPGNRQAVMVCAIAACNLRDRARAEHYVGQLRNAQRKQMARQICRRNGIEIE